MDDTVTLQIKGTSLQCNRGELIQSSDYFKAMFEGNFIESDKNVIQLNEVDPEGMKTVLKLLWDKEHVIEEKNILSVLQAACMLQFLQVKEICLEQIERTLSVNNCLKFWLYTEHLMLKSVCFKAKLLALMEFTQVKETEYFVELALDEVVSYLGNVNLQCLKEFDVWQAVVRWCENSEAQSADTWMKLLSCINFRGVTVEQIHHMISSRFFVNRDFICSILRCIAAIKNCEDLFGFSEKCLTFANILLSSKDRNFVGFPCIVLDNVHQSKSADSTVYYYDKFKRKRKYSVLEMGVESDFFVVYVVGRGLICRVGNIDADTLRQLFALSVANPMSGRDVGNHSLKPLFDIETKNFASLDGFDVTAYKNLVFLYGGEYVLGKGKWNLDFCIYDVLSTKWRKKRLPFPRRHFESCVCGNYLYVVGGTGPFRVIQENLFWYDIHKEEWSKEIKLPCSGRQIKCCSFQDTLHIVDINNRRVYRFCHDADKWNTLEICDSGNRLPFFSKNVHVFSHRGSLYIKEKILFRLDVQNCQFVISNEIQLPEGCDQNGGHQKSVFSNEVLYSLSKQSADETAKEAVVFELLNVEEVTSSGCQRTVNVSCDGFKFRSSLMVFNVFHPALLDGNDLIGQNKFLL